MLTLELTNSLLRKETCEETYLGIEIFRFYMKCRYCHSELTIITDPKNHDYVCEYGGSRTYEAWRDAREAEERLAEIREEEEEGNAMRFLENRTKESKREMEFLDALDEIREMTRAAAKIGADDLFNFLCKRDKVDMSMDEKALIRQKFQNRRRRRDAQKAQLEKARKQLKVGENPVKLVDKSKEDSKQQSQPKIVEIKQENPVESPMGNLWNLKPKIKVKPKIDPTDKAETQTNTTETSNSATNQAENPPNSQIKPSATAFCDYSDSESDSDEESD